MWPLTSPASKAFSFFMRRSMKEWPVLLINPCPPRRLISASTTWEVLTSKTILAPGWRVRRSRESMSSRKSAE